MSIELTSEELALIEQKRAEDKAKAEAMATMHEKYVEEKVARTEVTLAKQTSEFERLKAFYTEKFNELKKLSPNYELVIVEKEPIVEVEIFNIDEKGYEITNYQDEEGNYKRHKPIKTIQVKGLIYLMEIRYTGETPNDYKYKINAIELTTKWGSFDGYKLRVEGKGFDSYDKRLRYTSAKKTHEKLMEVIANQIRQIEYNKIANERSERLFHAVDKFMEELSDKYPNASVSRLLVNSFVVNFNNGVKVTINVDVNSEGEARMYGPKVDFNYGEFSIDGLLEIMSSIKGEK